MIGQIFDRLTDEIRRIWVYRWLVALVTATLMAAAVAYTSSVPNIFEAKDSDFKAQTHKIYRALGAASYVQMSVVGAGK